jgi:hypothetical protein
MTPKYQVGQFVAFEDNRVPGVVEVVKVRPDTMEYELWLYENYELKKALLVDETFLDGLWEECVVLQKASRRKVIEDGRLFIGKVQSLRSDPSYASN